MSQSISQIPLPGGSGGIPTGAMQFQDDWPGLFIRGDAAIPLLGGIRTVQERLADSQDMAVVIALSRLAEIAGIIERDVIVRGEAT